MDSDETASTIANVRGQHFLRCERACCESSNSRTSIRDYFVTATVSVIETIRPSTYPVHRETSNSLLLLIQFYFRHPDVLPVRIAQKLLVEFLSLKLIRTNHFSYHQQQLRHEQPLKFLTKCQADRGIVTTVAPRMLMEHPSAHFATISSAPNVHTMTLRPEKHPISSNRTMHTTHQRFICPLWG